MKPSIYIGLGGIGCLTLSHIKKQFENEYGVGKIPTEIAFLGIDYQTDMDEDPSLASDNSWNFCSIRAHIDNLWDFYKIRSEENGEFSWMFEQNGNTLPGRTQLNQPNRAIRTTGRLMLELHLSEIMHKLEGIIYTCRQNAMYEYEDCTDIYIITSLCGGTGAGMLIPLVAAILDEYNDGIRLVGCGVTHGCFGVTRTSLSNITIASIMDLDYVMHASPKYPIEMEVGGRQIKLTQPIFDEFYMVDSKLSPNNKIFSLSEGIGFALYAFANFRPIIDCRADIILRSNLYNVHRKIGWVMSLGACQVVYKGELLAHTYGLKAGIELIRKMRQEGAEIHQAALNWTEEVGIREDGNEYNLLTDSIYAPATIQKLRQPYLDVTHTDAAIQDSLNRYFVSLVDFPTEEILKNRTTALKEALHYKVEKYLLSENGVGNSLKFLGSLKRFCEKYRTEMDEEAKKFNQSKEEKQANFDASALKRYNYWKHGRFTWNRNQRNQELLDYYVARPAKEILKDLHEAKRRESARDIFIALLAEIDILIQSLRVLDQKLAILSYEYETELLNVQREAADALIFEYDLSYNERVNMTIDSNDIVVADFIYSLGKSLTKIGIDTELNEKIKQYTESLPQAQNYREKLITEVIDNLPDDEYEYLKREIQVKSARRLRIDDRGLRVNSGKSVSVMNAVMTQWVVSRYKQHDCYFSRLENDGKFIPDANNYLYFANEALRQRMIFFRIDGCIIPYCIDFIDYYAMKRYKKYIQMVEQGLAYNPHIDRHWFEKMHVNDFSLDPDYKSEAFFYWVCGQLFGALDKNGVISSITENERIMKTDENNVPLTEEKKEQQSHTKYIYYKGKGGKKYVFFDPMAPVVEREKDLGSTRDVAFAVFKKDIFPKYKSRIADDIKKQFTPRIAYWEERIKEIARLGIYSYIDRIVCSDKSSAIYFRQGTTELDLLSEEFYYIKYRLEYWLHNLIWSS